MKEVPQPAHTLLSQPERSMLTAAGSGVRRVLLLTPTKRVGSNESPWHVERSAWLPYHTVGKNLGLSPSQACSSNGTGRPGRLKQRPKRRRKPRPPRTHGLPWWVAGRSSSRVRLDASGFVLVPVRSASGFIWFIWFWFWRRS